MHAGRLFLGAAVATALAATPAHADRYSAHVAGTAAAGYTDNILSVADDSVPGPEEDFFYELNPGAFAVYERPTQIHELTYGVSARLFQSHDEANSVSHRGGWRGYFRMTPRTNLNLAALADYGRVNAFSTQGANDQGMITTIPGGRSRYLSLEARQALAHEISRVLRGAQEAWVRRFETFDQEFANTTAGYEIGNSLSADRSWKSDAVAGTVTTTYADLRREQNDGSIVGEDQLGLSLRATWRHDLNIRWNTNVYGGVATILDPSGEFDSVIQPEAGASINYFPLWGAFGASYRRGMTVNLLVAQNTVSDEAVIHGWLPLPWLRHEPLVPRFTVSGTGGILRSSTVNLSEGVTSSAHFAYVADAALHYTPMEAMAVSLRYQFFRQEADTSALMAFGGYTKNTLMLTVTGRFPRQQAASIPMRAPLRVDRADATGGAGGEEAFGIED